MDSSISAEKPWRRLAGNILMYDTMGASQFSLLTLFFGLECEAERIGMKAARLGRVFQDWFCIYHEENQIALDGIEQASQIAWSKVLPKWETPPDWGNNHLEEKKSA